MGSISGSYKMGVEKWMLSDGFKLDGRSLDE